MAYTVNTTIPGDSAGDPATIIAWAKGAGAKRPDDVARYITEVYRLAGIAKLRAEVVIAQAIHECSDVASGAPFASSWWVDRCNPAGIGITGDPAQDDASADFQNGTSAAKAHVTHLYLYAVGTALPAGLSAADDPRWDVAVAAGRAGIAPTIAGLTNTWGMDPNYANALLGRLIALSKVMGTTTPAPSSPPASGGTSVGKIVHGNVPFPGFIDHQALTANKPEGVGWDNIALWGDKSRTPMFLVLHRMWGDMAGTDSPGWFGSPTVGALTDYGLATANVDGPDMDGIIIQWNNPRGYRVPWASGPVSAPYGDAVKWLNWSGNKWGLSICNACGVSIENSGKDVPLTDFAFGELAKFVAYWFDQFGIDWDKAPIHPKTGISAITWHQEWTIGTGKECPWSWIMDHTQALIDAAAAIMKPYQTGETAAQPAPSPEPTPQPAPKPQYAKPAYINELALLKAENSDTARAVVSRDGTKFLYVGDRVRAVRDTPRLQYAAANSAPTGPVIPKGTEFDVMWRFTAKDGRDYFYTPYATRILADDCERVSDVPDYASNA